MRRKMNREIKFRAWIPQEKKVLSWEALQDYYGGDDAYYCLFESLFTENSDWKVMQFTGLKDKNGKEIYESDLLLIPEGYGGDFRYKECVAEIKYDEGCFYAHNLSHKDGIVMQDFQWNELEVIGNIYENGDLIKEVK
jgi:uncharacterized phage protein (TIGR01671 family)